MTDVDWFVMVAALGVASAGGYWYQRRRRRGLSAADLEFAVVDPLSAAGFTRYCAALVLLLGYQRVRRARGGAVSLTATSRYGTPVAIRCALQKDPVAADAVSALGEAITAGRYAGRTGIPVTNALVTPQARALASDAGITVADRAVLRHWMELARRGGPGGTLDNDAGPVAAPADGHAHGRATGVRVLAGTLGCAALALVAVAIHVAIGTGTAGRAIPSAAAPSAADLSTAVASPASTASPVQGGDLTRQERHLLHVEHVKHVEHMRHVAYVGRLSPGQQG
jgi:hypothetical protein